jgi:hypothetical protein
VSRSIIKKRCPAQEMRNAAAPSQSQDEGKPAWLRSSQHR